MTDFEHSAREVRREAVCKASVAADSPEAARNLPVFRCLRIADTGTNRARPFAAVFVCALIVLALSFGCGKVPLRQYYMLNYVPQPMLQRTMQNPYACVLRLKEFSIEEAYNRAQIVYRQSPYELRYYHYRLWAVKPTRMITDLAFKHFMSINLVNSVIRRYDEGKKPDYELSGIIEALEEYDSDDLLFAHAAIRMNLTRLSDGANIYSRLFDVRKRVHRREADFVIREMSQIMEYIFAQAAADIDAKLAAEFGMADAEAPAFTPVEEPTFISDSDGVSGSGKGSK